MLRSLMAVAVLTGCQHLTDQPTYLQDLCDDWRVIRPNNMAEARRIPRHVAKSIIESNRNREIRGCAKFENRPARNAVGAQKDTLRPWVKQRADGP